MKQSVINHFNLRPVERQLLTVLEFVFGFCTLGLFLAVFNQSGGKLTEGSVQVSDTLSIVCESLLYTSMVVLLVIARNGLKRVGDIKGVATRVNLLTAAIILGITYIVFGKLSLFYYGTEQFPVVLDWTVTIVYLLFILLITIVFTWIKSHSGRALGRYLNRVSVVLCVATALILIVIFLVFAGLPDGVLFVSGAITLIAICCIFVMLSRTLKYKGDAIEQNLE